MRFYFPKRKASARDYGACLAQKRILYLDRLNWTYGTE